MADLDERERRVRQIAESLFGSLLSRDRDVMVIEVPADLLGGALGLLGQGGFGFNIGKQSTRMTTKRVTGLSGQIVVCEGHEELMAFYQVSVDLTPRTVRVAACRTRAPSRSRGRQRRGNIRHPPSIGLPLESVRIAVIFGSTTFCI
jgi:hypothetical protein